MKLTIKNDKKIFKSYSSEQIALMNKCLNCGFTQKDPENTLERLLLTLSNSNCKESLTTLLSYLKNKEATCIENYKCYIVKDLLITLEKHAGSWQFSSAEQL